VISLFSAFLSAFAIRIVFIVMGTASNYPFWDIYLNVLLVIFFFYYPIRVVVWLFGG
jgi:hypothetical protein